ncbi:MAG: hypothetical protein EB116_16575 [Betaproteobacteria bacterium]|nr:hypothetical protein [Betaproteobacteria bacterium]
MDNFQLSEVESVIIQQLLHLLEEDNVIVRVELTQRLVEDFAFLQKKIIQLLLEVKIIVQ